MDNFTIARIDYGIRTCRSPQWALYLCSYSQLHLKTALDGMIE